MTHRDTAPQDRWHFARPALARAYLDAFDLQLSSARGMFARRRMGKTEFLRKDLLPAALERGYLVAYTNLWDNQSAPETALLSALADALEPHGAQKLISRLKPPVSKVKASAKFAGHAEGALEAEFATPEAKASTLRTLFKALDKQSRPLLLVIDEAQVLARAEHRDFAHALRAGLDIRKDKIKVVFSGSSEMTLRTMFARASEPFYNWAPLEPFPLLGEEFVAFTVDTMNSIARNVLTLAQGKKAFEELQRTPDFFRRFIQEFLLNPFDGDVAALERTKHSVFSSSQFVNQWSKVNKTDQGVLTLLAAGASELHSQAALEKLSTLTGKTVTRNMSAQALRRLQAENIVAKLALGEYQIEDEAFAEWIRRRNQP